MITQAKQLQLLARMQEIGLQESDLEEKFILARGHGGQKVQKTASCVWLKHIPTGITIKCQNTRMRADNRYFARKRLCEKLEERLLGEESKKQQEIEKIRRQKKRRSRRTQEKILAEKHHKSDIKKLRTKPDSSS
jgi:protein subunit release factor B